MSGNASEMSQKTPYFSHIFIVAAPVSNALFSVSTKSLLPKSSMCSDWSAGPACWDWSTASTMLGKCHIPYHNHKFQHITNATHPVLAPFILHNALGMNFFK